VIEESSIKLLKRVFWLRLVFVLIVTTRTPTPATKASPGAFKPFPWIVKVLSLYLGNVALSYRSWLTTYLMHYHSLIIEYHSLTPVMGKRCVLKYCRSWSPNRERSLGVWFPTVKTRDCPLQDGVIRERWTHTEPEVVDQWHVCLGVIPGQSTTTAYSGKPDLGGVSNRERVTTHWEWRDGGSTVYPPGNDC